jgi:hypothetical protein
VNGGMPQITGEPAISISELIIDLLRKNTTTEEIQDSGVVYIKTNYTNYKKIASDISKDNERVRKELIKLASQKDVINLNNYYYIKKGIY